jgi:hypothetical protein
MIHDLHHKIPCHISAKHSLYDKIGDRSERREDEFARVPCTLLEDALGVAESLEALDAVICAV